MENKLFIFKDNKCFYCHQNLNREEWTSRWAENDEHHYKSLTCCKCGKRNWLQVDFFGSGHDPLLKKDLSPLESMVKKVAEK